MHQKTIGSRKGDYEILELLGTGGMGRVFKVRNIFSDRIEAMKVLYKMVTGQRPFPSETTFAALRRISSRILRRSLARARERAPALSLLCPKR